MSTKNSEVVTRMISIVLNPDGTEVKVEAQGCMSKDGIPFMRVICDDTGDVVELRDRALIDPIYSLIQKFHVILADLLMREGRVQ